MNAGISFIPCDVFYSLNIGKAVNISELQSGGNVLAFDCNDAAEVPTYDDTVGILLNLNHHIYIVSLYFDLWTNDWLSFSLFLNLSLYLTLSLSLPLSPPL